MAHVADHWPVAPQVCVIRRRPWKARHCGPAERRTESTVPQTPDCALTDTALALSRGPVVLPRSFAGLLVFSCLRHAADYPAALRLPATATAVRVFSPPPHVHLRRV